MSLGLYSFSSVLPTCSHTFVLFLRFLVMHSPIIVNHFREGKMKMIFFMTSGPVR